jgi:hypothetical protein
MELRTSLIALLGLTSIAAGCVPRSRSANAAGIPTVGEIEPNDDEDLANVLGVLRPGDRLRIRGHIAEAGFDRYDGFAFVSAEPITVSFSLDARDPAADLDVCVWDPALHDFVACFESPYDPEVGSFEVLAADTAFHLVVLPFAGGSDYTLEVSASCCATGLASDATAALGAAVVGAPAGTAASRHADRARYGTRDADPDPDDVTSERGRGVLIEVDEAGAVRAVLQLVLTAVAR